MRLIKNTTLCYIEQDEKYLMLLRNKKENDENEGKWIGVGGKFKEGESPEECLVREVFEETGLSLIKYRFRGIVTFVSDKYGTEYMHLYTANKYSGDITDCDEGELKWIPKSDILNLPLWEGDKAFLKMLFEESPLFSMKLTYKGDDLVDISTQML